MFVSKDVKEKEQTAKNRVSKQISQINKDKKTSQMNKDKKQSGEIDLSRDMYHITSL